MPFVNTIKMFARLGSMTLPERVRMLLRLWRYRLGEEQESLAFLRRQPLNGRTVLDIGANKGIYAYWMSRQVGPRGRVFAFEPQVDLRPHLEELKRSFRLDNLQLVSQALSDRRGTAGLRRDKPGSLGATLEAEQPVPDWPVMAETVDVELNTLDHFCESQGLDEIALIKCDVEGHELAAFRGGRGVLQKQRPVLLFECHHHVAEQGELFGFLRELGYDGNFYHDGKPIPYQRFAEFPYRKPSIHFRNYMFAHREAPAQW
jgi:FkbM family methyltransferase